MLVEALVLEESWEKGEEKREARQALLPGCGWAAAAEGAHPSSWSMLGVEGRWERTEVGGSTRGGKGQIQRISSSRCQQAERSRVVLEGGMGPHTLPGAERAKSKRVSAAW